jgi:hypothetical protein
MKNTGLTINLQVTCDTYTQYTRKLLNKYPKNYFIENREFPSLLLLTDFGLHHSMALSLMRR